MSPSALVTLGLTTGTGLARGNDALNFGLIDAGRVVLEDASADAGLAGVGGLEVVGVRMCRIDGVATRLGRAGSIASHSTGWSGSTGLGAPGSSVANSMQAN